MNNVATIITKLKSILSQSRQAKVHDKDVAAALGIAPSTLASMKRRNTPPYKAILDFCALHRINANALLFNRPVNNLIDRPATIRYYDEIGAGAGGGGTVLDEGFKELTVNDMLLLFFKRLEEHPGADAQNIITLSGAVK